MTVQFLPESYVAPRSNGSYTKLNNGSNKLRILSAPILGWEDWVDKSPIRYRMDEKPATWHDASRPGKHFWAVLIWNYQEERVQIFHITQGSIRKSIEELSKDSDWGAPFFYDIKITREGEGLKTKYTVNPLPHKVVDPVIEESFKNSSCNLDALFEGADPFGLWETYTPGVFTKQEQSEDVKFSSDIKSSGKGKKKCSQDEYDSFIDVWSMIYDQDLLNMYIKKRSEHFSVDVKDTVSFLMSDNDEFEREFKTWSSKQKTA